MRNVDIRKINTINSIRKKMLHVVKCEATCMSGRDENGTDIFRPYSIPNQFRGVLIRPYPSPDI
jgi:hypothetical protein